MKSSRTGATAPRPSRPTRSKKTGQPQTRRSGSRPASGIEGPHEVLKLEGDEVLILGTAHVSKASVTDVEMAFKNFRPDSVCVELCRPRHEALLDPDRWKNMDLAKVIREKKLALLASNLILSSFQKKLGEKADVRPGQEMLRASELAREKGLELVLADREIRTTLSRAWAKVGFLNRMWLAAYLGSSLLVSEEIDPDQIEEMKKKDALEDLFSILPERYRNVKEVLIDERDAYLAENIRRTALLHHDLERHPPGVPYDVSFSEKKQRRSKKASESPAKKSRRILAVVGAGHLPGISRVLKGNQTVDIEELRSIPRSRPLRNLFIWVGSSVIIFLVGFYFMIGGRDAVQDTILVWVLARSAFSGVGALLAGAHPLTILTTIVMAPVVPFIPGSRLFMFAGLVEVWARKPRVEDFENIATDTNSLGGLLRSFFKNRVLHLFLVTSMVSTGLTIGNLTFLQRLLAGILRSQGW